MTHRLAEQIYREIAGVQHGTVWLCSRIGDPVDQPQLASIEVALDDHVKLADVERPIQELVVGELSRMPRAGAREAYDVLISESFDFAALRNLCQF